MVLKDGDVVEFGDQMLKVSNLAEETPSVIFEPLDSGSPSISAPAEPAATPIPEAEVKISPIPDPVPPVNSSSAAASSAAAPHDDAKKGGAELLEAIRRGGSHLFDGGRGRKNDGREAAEKDGRKKSPLSNVIYLLIIVCVIFMGFSLFQIVSAPKKVIKQGAQNSGPFVLFYEKMLVSDDNVFRFTVSLENGDAVFTVDDLKSQRHFRKEIKNVDPELLNNLKRTLEKTDVISSSAPPAGPAVNNQMQRYRIMLLSDGRMNDITVLNDSPPRKFSDAEYAINGFAANFAMQTQSMTKEELMGRARDLYLKANEYFENRDAHPANLRKAITNFEIVSDYLEEFSPKPPLLLEAKEKLAEAEKVRKQRMMDWEFNYERAFNYRDFGRMRTLLREKMELFDNNSKEYSDARYKLSRLDALERTSGKR